MRPSLESIAARVRQHWSSQAIPISLLTSDLIAMRRLRPAGTWGEYESFLRLSGVPQAEDREGVRFWLPRDLRPATEVLASAGYRAWFVDEVVVFADYLQASYWYGLWLTGPFSGSVSLVLGTDDGRLYPPS